MVTESQSKKPLSSVTRTESDFLWLRTSLISEHPDKIIPPLPSDKRSKMFSDPYGASSLQAKRRFYQRFMNAVYKEPLFQKSATLSSFLQLSQENLEKFKQSVSKQQSVLSKLTDLSKWFGKSEKPKGEKYVKAVEYFQSFYGTLKQIRNSLNETEKKSNELAISFNTLANSVADMKGDKDPASVEMKISKAISGTSKNYENWVIFIFQTLIHLKLDLPFLPIFLKPKGGTRISFNLRSNRILAHLCQSSSRTIGSL